MKRKALAKMLQWKDQQEDLHQKKPLLLTGMRGTGKTYLALDFAKDFFEVRVYLNLETDFALCTWIRTLVQETNSPEVFFERLAQRYEIPEALYSQLFLIFDEIDRCPELCALLAAAYAPDSSHTALPMVLLIAETMAAFPTEADISAVFQRLTITPLDFQEYLEAVGQAWYADVITGHYAANRRIPEIVHQEMLDYFADYLVVGGMPAAVNTYLSNESFQNVSEQHMLLYARMLLALEESMPEGSYLKTRQVLQAALQILCKPNKKFQMSAIRKGVTHQLYAEAFSELSRRGYLLACHRMNEEALPSPTQFKLYFPDVGMLRSLLLHYQSYDVPANRSAVLLENYCMQTLSAKLQETPHTKLCFWESDAQAKVDFVLHRGVGEEARSIPLDLRCEGEKSRTKSVRSFQKGHNCPYTLRLSEQNFEQTGTVHNLPYYALFCFSTDLSKA